MEVLYIPRDQMRLANRPDNASNLYDPEDMLQVLTLSREDSRYSVSSLESMSDSATDYEVPFRHFLRASVVLLVDKDSGLCRCLKAPHLPVPCVMRASGVALYALADFGIKTPAESAPAAPPAVSGSADGLLRPQERDTILAALRMWQDALDDKFPGMDAYMSIAADSGSHLGSKEVGELCERLNVTELSDEDVLETLEEYQEAMNFLDTLGAPRDQGVGMLTLKGRVDALLNKGGGKAQ